ncbi:MAG TPA: SPFH domain-containing protein [Anaerolineae bacterium]|nr:SPFH domain-containing protein [Anaerolineae bacterium]
MNKSGRISQVFMIILVLILLFLSLVLVTLRPLPEKQQLNITVLLIAFAFNLCFAILLILRVFAEFAQQFYDLSSEEAMGFVSRLMFGDTLLTLLEVQEGRVHPEGAAILRHVGGPGKLRIAHDSAVVTQRVARLHRVLGPGLHTLEPFEKIWDVIDLRWQRRSVRLEFMTRDGLPVYCEADIRFRVDGGRQAAGRYYTYTETAVLGLAALKRVRADTDTPFQEWPERVVGLLQGEMRNILEQYSLDEFLNPRYGLPQAPTPLPKPCSLTELEERIEAAVTEAARTIGVTVDDVQLGPVLPAEGAISQQWLEFWRANMQRLMAENAIEGDAIYTNLILQAQVNAKVELITTMLNEVRTLSQSDMDVPAELIVLSFVDVMRSIAQRDPATQQVMFTQAEKLMHILQEL